MTITEFSSCEIMLQIAQIRVAFIYLAKSLQISRRASSDDGMRNTATHANGVNYQKGKILKKSNLDLLVGREINEE